MNSRRTLILIAAVVVGAVAALALLGYVRGIEDRANDNAERVKVFTIAQPIPKGTFGQEAFRQGLIVESEIPREFFPATAITDEGAITDQVAISNLAANQVVVGDQFVPQAEALTSFSDLLDVDDPENVTTQRVAITISVDQIRGVAGLLVPGDFVNVLIVNAGAVNADLAAPADSASGNDGAASDAAVSEAQGSAGVISAPSRFLYQKVQIIAIGQQREIAAGDTVATDANGDRLVQSSGLLTVAVPADAAQRLASVDSSSIYLTLVSRDYVPYALPALDLNDPVPGEDANQLTPYGPEGTTDE